MNISFVSGIELFHQKYSAVEIESKKIRNENDGDAGTILILDITENRKLLLSKFEIHRFCRQ